MPRPAEKKHARFDPAPFRKALVAWFEKSGRDLPWRRTRDPYAILVSEIMLQQTQVVTVVGYFERWMERFPGFASLAAATEAEVLSVWQGLGYYSRARNLHRAAQIVVRELAGILTPSPAEIGRLPGIGRYTAGAVATFAFDVPAPIVDANIARVLARLFNLRSPVDSTAGREELWARAAGLQPVRNARLFNSAIMELGALVCLPRSPKCPACAVQKYCQAPDPGNLPVKKAPRKTVAIEEDCAWITGKGRILLEQQTGPRWRGLWKLPSIRTPAAATPLLQFAYPFTHHRVTLSIFSRPPPKTISGAQAWFDLREIGSVAIAAPHRRAIDLLKP